jgi:type II secretory pathway pseudopilin PulG
MLVVIAVIAILMGLLLPTIAAVREKAKVKATMTLVQGLSAALERYKEDFDDYPPSNTDLGLGGTIEADSLYRYLCGKEGRGLTRTLGTRTIRYEPYIQPPQEHVKKVGTEFFLVDSWGMEVKYANSKEYTDAQIAGNPSYVDDGKCRNPKSFDLWSTGPDRKQDPDPLKLKDDITNW